MNYDIVGVLVDTLALLGSGLIIGVGVRAVRRKEIRNAVSRELETGASAVLAGWARIIMGGIIFVLAGCHVLSLLSGGS